MKRIILSVVLFATALISISFGRTWTDNKGHKITADYESLLQLNEPKVKLKTSSGKYILVPVRNLSQEDQDYIKEVNSNKPASNQTERNPTKENAGTQKKNSVDSIVYAAVQNMNIDSREAYDALIHIRESDPTNLEPDFTIALLFIFKKKDYLHAQQHLMRCLKINPNDAGVHLNLGTLCILQGKYPEAYGHYQKAYTLGGVNQTLNHNLHKLINETSAHNIFLSPPARKKYLDLSNKVSQEVNKTFNKTQGWMFEKCSEGIAQESYKCHWFQMKGYRPYEYPICMKCNGTGRVGCPNPNCSGGKVAYYVNVTRTFPNGETATMLTRKLKACSVCGGRNFAVCPICKGSGAEYRRSSWDSDDDDQPVGRNFEDLENNDQQEQKDIADQQKQEQEANQRNAAEEDDEDDYDNLIEDEDEDEQQTLREPQITEQPNRVKSQDPQTKPEQNSQRQQMFDMFEDNENNTKNGNEEEKPQTPSLPFEEITPKEKEDNKFQINKARSAVVESVVVSVVKAKIDHVRIQSAYSERVSVTPETYLILDVAIINQSSTSKIDFDPWSGNSSNQKVKLTDEFGNNYKCRTFGSKKNNVDDNSQKSIYPDSHATDRLYFEPPIKNAKKLILTLSGENVEKDDNFKIEFNVSDVEK